VDDLTVGRAIRAVRVRRRLRQSDLARATGVSQSTISRIEMGRLAGLPLGTLRRVAAGLGMRVSIVARWEGADLDRLLGARHSAMHEEVARLFADLPGWDDTSEVTFAIYAERGAIDILAWHAVTRSLLVIELKTEIVDVQETVGTLDRKVRLAGKIASDRGWVPATVSSWLLIADSPTNRRRVAAHRAMLRSRFPVDGRRILGWLREPSGAIHALSFLSPSRQAGGARQLAPVRRVRKRRSSVSGAA
jgi:transcriptional regulator with XRE-family HTH domain